MLAKEHSDWPMSRLCAAFGVARSSVYYAPVPTTEDEVQKQAVVQAAVLKIAGEWPTYGYRRITAQLRREGQVVNSKYVRRLRQFASRFAEMHEMGLAAKPSPRKKRTTNSDHDFARFPNRVKGLTVAKPDQVWVADITYIALRQEFVYLAVLMDVFTRSIRGWNLSRQLDTHLTLTALKRALAQGKPAIHHSDQGVQYAATDYVQALQAATILVSMASVGCPEENGYAERLMRTIKEEEVALNEYNNFEDVNCRIGRFLNGVYQIKRIHSSLGYLTPAEFEQTWNSSAQEQEKG
jgi:transposase InsO family protein